LKTDIGLDNKETKPIQNSSNLYSPLTEVAQKTIKRTKVQSSRLWN